MQTDLNNFSVPSAKIFRGDRLESLHRATAVACRRDGRILFALGDPQREIYPRSAFKPFQALANLELGGHQYANMSDTEVSLSCASHSGEQSHTQAVHEWLSRLNLTSENLLCGAEAPFCPSVAKALFISGKRETKLHHNCSGKHSAMLTACCAQGWPVENYCDMDHPLQQRIRQTAQEITGCMEMQAPAIDGCSAPTAYMPIKHFAQSMARLADPSGQSPLRRNALNRIFLSMRKHPHMMSGSHRSCADFINACPDVVAKFGSEGVYGLAIRSLGIGIAVKSDDGAERGVQVATAAILEALDLIAPEKVEMIKQWSYPVLKNAAGQKIGHITPAQSWLAAISL
jgi:L-asparaginase II